MLISIHSAYKYLVYKLFSRHRKGFGIHSPFVFDIVTRVFRNKIDRDIVCKIENLRKAMLSESKLLSVTDYGSGGSRNSSRNLSDIARNSSLPARYCNLIAVLAGEYGGDTIIEMGTSLGISTMYLSHGSPSSTVHTAEGCPVLAQYASESFRAAGRSNIVVHNKTFDDFLVDTIEKDIRPGLVFIDGDHRGEALKGYFNRIITRCGPGSIIVMDDIHSTAGMTRAWEEIRSSKDVNVSVDIYRMGILFIKEGIAKMHYTIRY